MKYEIDNFTAILPVTCNADCDFCPEKESDKISKDLYIKNLIKTINETVHLGYDHVSISGGEPSLDCRLLGSVINAIITETPIQKIGLTTNGQFLENVNKFENLLNAITDDNKNCLLDFINISRHSIRTDVNNSIMKVNYKHSIRDIINFRNLLPNNVSFHINTVITENTDTDQLFSDVKIINPLLLENNISIAMRTDYKWQEQCISELVPLELYNKFINEFNTVVQISGCPTCITYQGTFEYRNLFLKGANFEPTKHDDVIREIIFHMNGIPYIDWKREKPFIIETTLDSLLGSATLPIDETLIKNNNHHNIIPTKSIYSNSGCGYSGCGYSSTIQSACGYSNRCGY